MAVLNHAKQFLASPVNGTTASFRTPELHFEAALRAHWRQSAHILKRIRRSLKPEKIRFHKTGCANFGSGRVNLRLLTGTLEVLLKQ
jgi:hypothetical protein